MRPVQNEDSLEYVRSLVREPRDGHSHPRRADQAGDENEQVCMVSRQALADLLGNRHQEDARDRVADEGGYNL